MRSKFMLIVGLALAALLTMGCGVCSLISQRGRDAALTKVAEEVEKQLTMTPQGKTTQPATPEGKATKSATPQPTPTPTAESKTPGETLTSLDIPTSYRYELTVEMTEGEKVTRMNGQGRYVQDPPAYEMTLEATEGENTNSIRTIQINQKIYIYDPDRDGWMVISAEDEDEIELFKPGELIKKEHADTFKLEKSETVNGQDCQVYKANAKDLAGLGGSDVQITDGTVRVWISKKLNLMVRYRADAVGKKSDDTAVKMTMQMDLFDINTAIKIEPPPEDKILEDLSNLETPTEEPTHASEGEAAKLPKTSDAQPLSGQDLNTAKMMAVSDDYEVYQTKLTIAQAAESLEKAYEEAGWSKESWSTVSEEMAVLFFSKNDRTAQVTISNQLISGIVVVVVSVY